MRVLIVTPYISSPIHPAFWTKAKQTGLGYIINDIAAYVGKKEDVDLFAYVIMSPSIFADGFNIIGHSYWSIIKNFKLKSIISAYYFLKKYPNPTFKGKLKTYGKSMVLSQLYNILDNYDVVHIHGISEATNFAVEICKQQKVKYLVTLHGLISFEDSVDASPGVKQYERDFLVQAASEGIPVTFVSSGIKETAENFIKNYTRNQQ